MLGLDPSFVLDTPLDELAIVEAVLNAALERRREYDEGMAAAIATMTANRVVPGLGKHITRLVRALASR